MNSLNTLAHSKKDDVKVDDKPVCQCVDLSKPRCLERQVRELLYAMV